MNNAEYLNKNLVLTLLFVFLTGCKTVSIDGGSLSINFEPFNVKNKQNIEAGQLANSSTVAEQERQLDTKEKRASELENVQNQILKQQQSNAPENSSGNNFDETIEEKEINEAVSKVKFLCKKIRSGDESAILIGLRQKLNCKNFKTKETTQKTEIDIGNFSEDNKSYTPTLISPASANEAKTEQKKMSEKLDELPTDNNSELCKNVKNGNIKAIRKALKERIKCN